MFLPTSLFMKLVVLVLTSSTKCSMLNSTTSRSFRMSSIAQMRFQRSSASARYEQVTSPTRIQCLTACTKSNYCRTVTFVLGLQTCYLYSDQLNAGRLIADSSAETIYVTARVPCEYILGDILTREREKISRRSQRSQLPFDTYFLAIPDSALLSLQLTKPSYWYPCSVLIGDVNHDNRLDMIVAQFHGQRGELFLGDGTGQFDGGVYLDTDWHPISVAAGYFNNDTHLDFGSVTFDYGYVRVFYGLGNGTFVMQYDYYDSYRKQALVVDDFNGDHRLDLAVTLYDNNSLTLHLADNAGGFVVYTGFPTGSMPFAMISGRFNDDDYADLAIVNTNSDSVSIFLGKSNGTFDIAVYPVGATPMSLAAGKFNNDNYTDIVVANFDNDTLTVLLGNGNGSFQNVYTYPAGGKQPRAVAVADMDQDGFLDLVVSYVNYGNCTIGVLLGERNGTFYLPTRFYSTFYSPDVVSIGDFNGDTRPDVVVLNSNNDTISIFMNMQP